MFIVEITRKENKQFFGVSDGDVIEGKLMGGTIITEIVKEVY